MQTEHCKPGVESSRGALLHESRKKMAAAKRRVAAKSSNRSLDEILVEADEFATILGNSNGKLRPPSPRPPPPPNCHFNDGKMTRFALRANSSLIFFCGGGGGGVIIVE